MFDFDIKRCTRRCAATQRELAPREVVYSVLVAEGTEWVRRDYCEQAWSEPPADVVAWWKWRLPAPGSRGPSWAPHDAMLGFFEELEGRPDQQDLRYVLALLLVRRRIARLERTESSPEGGQTLYLFSAHHEREHQVAVCEPTAERLPAIERELERLLICEAPASGASRQASESDGALVQPVTVQPVTADENQSRKDNP